MWGTIVLEIILLFGAGLLGGAVNSLAGGGSFIVFPALLLAGVPPVMANASNTYAALPGYISGSIGFWRDIVKYRDKLILYSIIGLIGGYAGAELLLNVSDAEFAIAVPWLMLIAVVLFAFGGQISAGLAHRTAGQKRAAVLVSLGTGAVMLAVCIYGGFFNAGMGILLLAAFALAGMDDIHAMNGLKLWVSAIVAIVAISRFALSGSIAWYEGSLAFAGTLIGGYVAARLAHRIPVRIIRFSIIGYGIVLTAYFFWKAYA